MNFKDNSARSGSSRILAGDIGGTYSRLAIYSHEASRFRLVRQETFSSPAHDGLTEVLTSFLQKSGEDVDAACLGLPAPIHSGVVYPLTNLEWGQVDRDQVLLALGTDRVALINDVEALAAGIQGLPEENLVCLQRGLADPFGNRVVISVGTGYGVSALTPAGRTLATEAGHASFSPRQDIDFRLYDKLQRKYGHVSWERVASGSALPSIYELLAPEHSPRVEASEIVQRSSTDPICRQAVETLRRYIGSAAGNIALTLMASGGLYLGGGAATKVLDPGSFDQFLDAFRDKGRMRPLLERVPVYIVDERDLALLGAAQKAVALFES